MNISVDGFTDSDALAAIWHIIEGSFRIIHRLLMQIAWILEIDHLQMVGKEVVEKHEKDWFWGKFEKLRCLKTVHFSKKLLCRKKSYGKTCSVV